MTPHRARAVLTIELDLEVQPTPDGTLPPLKGSVTDALRTYIAEEARFQAADWCEEAWNEGHAPAHLLNSPLDSVVDFDVRSARVDIHLPPD